MKVLSPEELDSLRLEHYSLKSEQIDLTKIQMITNRMWNKPHGGLWSCPVGAELSWSDYILTQLNGDLNDFYRIEFGLNPNAKILCINTRQDYARLPIQSYLPEVSEALKMAGLKIGSLGTYVCYETLAKSFDGIFISSEVAHQANRSLNNMEGIDYFGGWDCETVFLFKGSNIKFD